MKILTPAFAYFLFCFSFWPVFAFAQQSLPEAPLPQQSILPISFVEPWLAGAQQNSQSQESWDKTQLQSSGQHPSKAEDRQRMLGIISTRNVVLSGHADPINSREKFSLWLHSAIDPFTFVSVGFTAGIEQAEDRYSDYGQGAEGFGKRFGASYADTVDGHLWGKGILPSVLHQDPRYFRSGQGTIKHRILYAVEGVVRCKGDNGHWQFAYSNIGGNFIGGAIANLYYPSADRGIGLVLDRGLVVTAEGAVGLIVSEFYPDIIAHLKKRNKSSQP